MLKKSSTKVEQLPEDRIVSELEEIDLTEWVIKSSKDIDVTNMSDRLNRYRRWGKNRAFYRGNQRGFWDAKRKTWVTVDVDTLSPSEASVLVVNNQFRPQVKTLAKEFSRSQIRVRANAISDSQRAILTARFSDALIKYYQPRLMPESMRQLEAKFLMLCGNSFRYTYFNPDKKSAQVRVKQIGDVTLPAYESKTCPECGYDAPQGFEGDKCPECGGQLEATNVPEKMVQGFKGYQSINAGDLVTEIVDPIEIEVWSGAQNLSLSPYLRRRRIVRSEFITKAYPFYKPQKQGQLTEAGVQQFMFLDTSVDNGTGNKYAYLYEYEQLWFDPEMYFNKKTKKEVRYKKKIGDKFEDAVIPAGTVLTDMFPNGLYVCRVGQDMLGFYNEYKGDCWVHIPYDVNIDGFWADGLEDAVMNQQIINEYTSLSVENVLYNASPKLVVNPVLINPVTVTSRPKDMLLLNNNATKETEPAKAFAQISGMSLTQEVMASIEGSKRDMREQTGALVAFNGQGDPTLTTATAMSIARDSALALVSTPLAIRAEREQDWCNQLLMYTKKYWYDQKYKFLLGKYNEEEADAFKESVLTEEINVYVESNSWQPETNYERLQNLGAYLTAFGIPMGFLNPMIPDVVREYAGQLYNVPFDFDEIAPDTRIAQKRLDMAKTIAEQQIPKVMMVTPALIAAGHQDEAQQLLMGTVVTISNAMGVEEDIDDHQVFIREYTKWLKTDEGQNANPMLREAVKQTIADHRAFAQTQQADAAAQQGAVNAMANPQPQPQPQGQAPFQPQNPSEHPFAPQQVGQIADFSKNK